MKQYLELETVVGLDHAWRMNNKFYQLFQTHNDILYTYCVQRISDSMLKKYAIGNILYTVFLPDFFLKYFFQKDIVSIIDD